MYQFRPIDKWPGAHTKNRKASQFRSQYSQTIRDLDRELKHLQARQVVIQIAVTERDIRNDGLPRSDAKPFWPGVILSFESKHGALSYPCDTYITWQENLRAIVLALEALRTVDRYGVTRQAEQYKGWAKLAAPPGDFASPQQAAEWLAGELPGGWTDTALTQVVPKIVADAAFYRAAYKAAAKALHPDVGGDEAKFKKLQHAAAVLNRHFRFE